MSKMDVTEGRRLLDAAKDGRGPYCSPDESKWHEWVEANAEEMLDEIERLRNTLRTIDRGAWNLREQTLQHLREHRLKPLDGVKQ